MDTENQTSPTPLAGRSQDMTSFRTPSGDYRDVEPEDANRPVPEQPGPNSWSIEMRYLPLAGYGHAFLVVRDPAGKIQRELHGHSRSRNNPGELLPLGSDGSRLSGVQTDRPYFDSPDGPPTTKLISTVYSGPYDDVVLGKWRSGLQAAADMNGKNLDYKSMDPGYLFGGDGGQIQNSNSGNYTFGKFMHLDLDSTLRNAGLHRTFPGWGRDLLDPTYRPYVAPPTFPTDNRQ